MFTALFTALYEELLTTMQQVCRQSMQRHAGEDFYCVALYTTGDCVYVMDSLATIQGLERCAKEYLSDPYYRAHWGTLDVALRKLKWSPCDSPYHCEFEREFLAAQGLLDEIWDRVDDDAEDEHMQTCALVHDTCIAVLTSIRDSGIFDTDRVIFNVLIGDQDDESRLLNAAALNSEQALSGYRRELEIDDERLRALRMSRLH